MKKNVKIEMLDHSKAKVELYGRYLGAYLNILCRVSFIEKIFIFDLMAGEGKDCKGSKGSPLVAVDVIKNHFLMNINNPQIEIWFNDLNMSEIEPEISKIQRIKNLISKETIPNGVTIKYFGEDYNIVLPKAISEIERSTKSKGLFFIDPYGYKDIDPDDLKRILSYKDTEILLFLPISPMYRFAKKSLVEPSPGSMPLRNFLIKLFGQTDVEFSSPKDFIHQLKVKLQDYIGDEVYVPTFSLKRNHTNIYCLFFFTNHQKGCEIMLDAIWRMDDQGLGYKQDNAPMLFSVVELSNYPDKLINFIKATSNCTNHDIYKFGLKNDFLPKHSNEVLKKLQKNGIVVRSSLDSKPARGNYIKHNSDRTVLFQIISED